MRTNLILIAAVAVALGGCNRYDADSQPQHTHLSGEVLDRVTTPAAPDRGPVLPDANTAAPGTDASIAFAAKPDAGSDRAAPSNVNPANEQHVAVAAQDAAAKAPDTATADAEKRRVEDAFANGEAVAPDVVAKAPITTPLTLEQSPVPQ